MTPLLDSEPFETASAVQTPVNGVRSRLGGAQARRLGFTEVSETPPHSQEAEDAVLGCLIMEPKCLDEAITEGLEPSWFYDLSNRVLFEAILGLHAAQKGVDLVTLVSRLENHGQLEDVGGYSRLSKIMDSFFSAVRLREYLPILRAKWLARSAISVLTRARADLRPGGDDTPEIIGRVDAELVALMDTSVRKVVEPLDVVTGRALDALAQQMSGSRGFSTGYVDLDRETGGMRPGQMWVLAGRPSAGKTALALCIAERVARRLHRAGKGGSVVVFSLEMLSVDLVTRLLAMDSGINTSRMDERSSTADQEAVALSAARVSELRAHLIIDDTRCLTASQLSARARRYKSLNDARLIVIDYLQLVQPDRTRENRREEVDEISHAVKRLSGELELPVLAAAQLNREFEKDKERVPRMSDLRESGAIEQDADVIGALYHRETPGNPRDTQEVVLRILKQRSGVKDLDVPFTFHPTLTRFDDRRFS